MATDHSLEVRRAVVAHLKGDATLIGLVGARVYGEKVPEGVTWPYVRVGLVIAGPRDHACHGGIDGQFAVSAFAKGGDAQLLYTMNRAISSRLHDASLSLDGGGWIEEMEWVNTTPATSDPEPEAYRSIIQFRVLTGEDNA